MAVSNAVAAWFKALNSMSVTQRKRIDDVLKAARAGAGSYAPFNRSSAKVRGRRRPVKRF